MTDAKTDATTDTAATAAEAAPQTQAEPAAPPAPAPRRRGLRLVLLVVLPLIAAAGGGWAYLSGGRYVTTDNAYVGAQKVLVTPEISGKVTQVMVAEGQRLAPGDALFMIDPEPYRIAAEEARAHLARVESDFDALKANLASVDAQMKLARQTLSLREADAQRKADLLAHRTGSRAELDTSEIAVAAARTQLEQLEQARRAALAQLRGDPAQPLANYAPWLEAKAALDRAERNLAQTVLRAPIAGVATQVASIQLGRFLQAGAAVFSIVSDDDPWVDANLKETDLTYVQPGQTVDLEVDAYPGRAFRGHVAAISPGTGAQFAILPPQNASGNWVKVVQRVPVRVAFDDGQDVAALRAGMSVSVSIDTRRERTLAGIFGLGGAMAHDVEPAKAAAR